MRILFPYPQAFGYFPDIFEYVTQLKALGIEAFYVGLKSASVCEEMPPHAIHLCQQTVSKTQFIKFVHQQIAEVKPDIVHVFHFRGCGVLPVASRKWAKKWLIDVRTIHVETQDFRVKSDFWLRDRLTWLETQSYNQILALTKTIEGNLKPTVRPVDTLPLGASLSRLNSANKSQLRCEIRQELNIPSSAPVLIYAGSLSPSRQISKLIKAFSRVLSRYPNARLLMVGGSIGYVAETDPLVQSLFKLGLAEGLASHLIFTGRVPYVEIPAYLAAADIGISYMPLGTPHQFQPPTKLIEYMMAELVVVSNEIPAIEDLITDDVNGILFGESEEEIVRGFSRALTLLNSENQDAYSRVIAEAKQSVIFRDWRNIVENKLIPIYERLSRNHV
ncbi:MAG: glycosyltransferase family 4 protein [Chloroflexota bacterium]